MRYKGKHVAEGPQKPKRQKRPGRLTGRQKALIVICVLLAVALAAVLIYRRLFVKPVIPGQTGGGDSIRQEERDYGEGVRPRADGERKSKDYYTVLILGRDTGGGGNTDTMLLASYDVTNQRATVMSIPRDTMVNIPYDIKRINAVYNYGGGDEKGIQALYQEIAQLVGFEPDYQVVVEWEAVGEIVNAMGGVYFDVPRNMNYDDPYQDLHIHQSKGYRLLTGEDAMQVLRYRHDNDMRYGYPDGDLGRIKTQQALLKAMVEQLLQLKNITKINEFAKVFQDNVETDLTFSNLCWFGKQAVMGGLKVENVNFVTMPNTPVSCWSRSYSSYQSYVTPNARELLDLVNNELSPFVEQFTLSDLDIMSVNRDGSVSSSTGHVEDSRAAVAPSSPAKTDPTPQEDEPPVTEDPEGGGQEPAGGGGGESTIPPGGGTGEPGGTEPPEGTEGPTGGETGENPGTGEEPGGEEPADGTAGETEPPPAETGGEIDWTTLPPEPGEPGGAA